MFRNAARMRRGTELFCKIINEKDNLGDKEVDKILLL